MQFVWRTGLPAEAQVKRDLAWCLLGGVMMLAVSGSMLVRVGYEQGAWEHRTIACWPTEEDPTPLRRP